MKLTSLSFSIMGILCIIMAALTALEVSPAFMSETIDFGATFTTTMFWGGLAMLLFLAGISFGVVASREL
jgi:hypothetical protein